MAGTVEGAQIVQGHPPGTVVVVVGGSVVVLVEVVVLVDVVVGAAVVVGATVVVVVVGGAGTTWRTMPGNSGVSSGVVWLMRGPARWRSTRYVGSDPRPRVARGLALHNVVDDGVRLVSGRGWNTTVAPRAAPTARHAARNP